MSFVQSARLTALGCAAALLLAGSAAAQAHDGDYAGVLKAGPQQFHLVLHVKTDKGETSAVVDSLDQGVSIPSAAIKWDGPKASMLFLTAGAELEGEFSADNTTFSGTWKQGLALPVTLTRQAPAPRP
ncbi:hypothetical protein [Phenylobacterium sp.]|uniref:hypothetical protein n=1 Tax=Phenylobacterium sp. TaxID=1871053 RepID=UPI002DF0348A|nr:hypothetical protein [Phenylobacterium sp.]